LVVVGIENDRVVGRDRKPAIGLDLGIELTRGPPGIAKGKQAPARTPALPDRAQDIEGGGEGDIVVDD